MAVRTGQDQDEGSSESKLLLTMRFLKIYWKIIFAVTWATFLAPFVVLFQDPQIRCAYVILIMGGYWITECFPMAVTSLLPVVLFPMLGVLGTAETCSCYMNDTIMVFIGGLVLALAIQHSNLHLRIALGVMKMVGCSHARLLAGVCAVTTFISMWVSNTAATAMMVPIIFAILDELEQVIQARYKDLGGITFHETGVAVLFGTCILLWIFRKPGFIRGWSEAITDINIQDSTPVIFVSILMFFIPKDPKFIYNYNSDPAKRPKRSSEGLITWNVIEKEMPWSLMFLLGGGFAISKGSIASGLAQTIGNALMPLRVLPPPLILILVSMFIGTITEFTSNVGIANITLPVIAQMSVAMKIHPMYLMIPATIMCSYSFRLPVGTPPNAIISMMGRIPTKWLIIGGCGPSIYSLLVQSMCFFVWSSWIYSANEFPSWAAETVESGENSKHN